jgi:hypothetical protein
MWIDMLCGFITSTRGGHGGKWEDKHKCGLLGFWAVSNIQQDWGLVFLGSQVETSKSVVVGSNPPKGEGQCLRSIKLSNTAFILSISILVFVTYWFPKNPDSSSSRRQECNEEVGLAEFPTILMVCGFVCQGFLGGPSKIAFQLRLDVNLGISKTWIYSDSFIIHIDSQGWFFCLGLPMLMLLVSSPGLRKKSLPGCWSFPCCVAMTLGYFGFL